MSFSNISPASIIGGTWSQIENRFLYCSNDTTTGGENSFTKNFDHTHAQTLSFTTAYAPGNGLKYGEGESIPNPAIATGLSSWPRGANGAVGDVVTLSEVEFDNMPAYQSIYCWRRTA